MSFCTRATLAAKTAVKAPTTATTARVVGASSNSGEQRATRNTPAVTMVAAWISAETGVGPSMASGSQVWSGTCADLPMAPRNSSMVMTVRMSNSPPRKSKPRPATAGAAPNTVSNSIELNTKNTAMMPSAKPKSPTRLTTKALIAAALALGRSYQKPISR